MIRSAAALAIAIGGIATSDMPVQDQRRVIEVTAERFAFFPSEIELEVGEEVELRIESDDTAHGFHIAGTTTNVSIPKRGQGTASVVVRFDTPGRHTFECSRMCGAGHHFMRGEILVRASEGSSR
jgi:cytochrome c oxidase subunit 2